jgi:RimJ/RimL family protein N-acetyltransferase
MPRVEDAEVVFAAYASDAEVTRYLSWRYYTEIEPLRTFLRGLVRTWETGEGSSHYGWMLCLRGTYTPIGSVGVGFDVHGAVIGYVLGRAYWNRGLMTEAVRYVAAWALAQPPLFRVWAVCDTENAASARVMEKAGFIREGVLRRWYPCPTIGPEPRDCLVYAKIR